MANEIGLAIIGSGRIGTLRAKLAAGHPAVRFIAVSDADPAKAKKLADSGRARARPAGSGREAARALAR
jgi:predicted dehydrogenase